MNNQFFHILPVEGNDLHKTKGSDCECEPTYCAYNKCYNHKLMFYKDDGTRVISEIDQYMPSMVIVEGDK